VNQHRSEILEDPNLSYRSIISQTFNKEFINMIQVCIFVPFLHEETPKPVNVVKMAPRNEFEIPQATLTA
jgi:hypothetical protein